MFDHIEDWKQQILESLARSGARPIEQLPRRWPRTHQVNRLLVNELVATGLLERVREPRTGRRLVRLTAAALDAWWAPEGRPPASHQSVAASAAASVS